MMSRRESRRWITLLSTRAHLPVAAALIDGRERGERGRVSGGWGNPRGGCISLGGWFGGKCDCTVSD